MKTASNSLRVFYILMTTQALSLIGSQMTSFALGIWVYERTGQATPLALMSVFATLPLILTAGFGGALADRKDRRVMMAIADTGQGVVTALLLIAYATNSLEIWHLYLAAFIESLFATIQFPAFQASVTMLVPDAHRDRANAIQQISGFSSGIIAPVLAGLLFGIVGVSGVMVIDLITFAVAVVVVMNVFVPQPTKTENSAEGGESFRQQMAGGFRFLVKNPPLLILVLTGTLINFPMRIMLVLITPYIIARTGSETTLGTLLGVMSAGGVAGGLLIGTWGGSKSRIRNIIVSVFASAIAMMLFGLGRDPIMLGFAMFMIMAPSAFIDVPFFSLLQLKVPAELQGRVFSVALQLVFLLRPVAFLTAGFLADKVLIPYTAEAGWDTFAPIFGTGDGAGMGLLISAAGLGSFAVILAMSFVPSFRNLETLLPDQNTSPEPAEDEPMPELVLEPGMANS